MKNQTYFLRVSNQTSTRFWINNVTKEQALLAIGAGAVGCTQNPSYTWKIIEDSADREDAIGLLKGILASGEKDDNEAVIKLQRELVSGVAKIFHPLYAESNGRYGYVSIQGDPFREDAGTIIRYARFNREAGENIMVKIPVTEDGLEAIAELAEEGIPINATEVMSVRQALDVCEVYERATRKLKNPAPIYYSHISGIFDEYLANTVKKNNIGISPDVLWQAGIAAAKKTYWLTKQKNKEVGFIGGGARGLHHFTEMVGADACITINWKGAAEELIKQDPPVVQRFLAPTPDAVIDELCEKLEDFRKGYFVNSISPEEYEHFGPVVLFRTMFEGNWKSAVDFVKRFRQGCF